MGKKERALRAARDKKPPAFCRELKREALVKIAKSHRRFNIDLVKTIILTLAGPIIWRLLQKDEWPSTLLVGVCIFAYLYFMNPLGSLREQLREFKDQFF